MVIIRALRAERLKVKRTLALWLAPLMPLVIIGLQLAIVLQQQEHYRSQDTAQAWTVRYFLRWWEDTRSLTNSNFK